MKVYKLTDADGRTRGGTQWGEGIAHETSGEGSGGGNRSDRDSERGGSARPATLARSLPDGCFILYRLVPSRTRPGKTGKLPIDPATLAVVSAQDQQYWRSYDDAAAIAAVLGPPYGVGFVLTPGCGVACLDVDGRLSPLALQLCADLPDAAREVSVSGKGIHLWVRYSGPEPAHAYKNVPLGIELYTSGRFIALGQAEGAIGADCTEALQAVIAKYFPPSLGTAAPAAAAVETEIDLIAIAREAIQS